MIKLFRRFKRDIAMMLTIILVVGLVSVMPVKADERIAMIDTNKMLCLGYDDGETITYIIKELILQGEVDYSANPVVNAVVKLNVLEEEGQGGESLVSYEVMRLTSKDAYGGYGNIYEVYDCDGTHAVSLVPVYTNKDGSIFDGSDWNEGSAWMNSDLGAIINDYNYYQALTEEIIDYFDAWEIVDSETTIDYGKVVEGLMSEEYASSYSIEYTYEDDNEYAGANKVERIVSGVGLKDYELVDLNNYDHGKKVEYNRLENLTTYRTEGEFDYLKMYKGGIYIDVDKLPTQSDSIVIPNLNRTQLLTLNSMYLNDKVLYNDGMTYNEIDVGYNLYDVCVPYSVETEDEAVEAWFDMLNIDYGVDLPSYDSYEMDNTRYDLYSIDLLSLSDIYIRMYIDYIESEKAYFIHKYEDKTIGDESEALLLGENKEIYIKGISLPEIDLTQEFETGREFSEYIWAYADYLSFVLYCYETEMGYETAYEIVMNNGESLEVSVYDVKELFLDIAGNIIVEPEEGEEDDYYYYGDPTHSIREIEGEIRISYEYTGYDYDMIESIRPIGNGFDEARATVYWHDIEWNYDSVNDCTAYETVCDIFANIGFNFEELEVIMDTESYSVLMDNQANEGVRQVLKDINSDQDNENGIYDEFIQYLKDEVVTFGAKVNYVEAGNSSQMNTSMDISGDSISIPIDMFDASMLGKRNVINQLWYAGNSNNFYVQVLDDEGETILHNGKEVKVKWVRADTSWHNYSRIDTLMGQLVALPWKEYLWSTQAAEIIFAKAPDAIEPQTVTTSNQDSVVITWDVPNDNGAEILGYQIAVVPMGAEQPTDDDYITVGDESGTYRDLGDDYEINWSTEDNTYEIVWLSTYSRASVNKSVDVYIRAVNVLGVSNAEKIRVVNENDNLPADEPDEPSDEPDVPGNEPDEPSSEPVSKPDTPSDEPNKPENPSEDKPATDTEDESKEEPKEEKAPVAGDNSFIRGFVVMAMLSSCAVFYLVDKKKVTVRKN